MERVPNEGIATPEKSRKSSNVEVAELRQEWVDELVAGCRTEADLFGPDGVFTRLKGGS